jgi:hypothetical protein
MCQRSVCFACFVALAAIASGPLSARADTLNAITMGGGFGLADGSRDSIAQQFGPSARETPVATAVPEPSGIALLGMGMIGAAVIVRRRISWRRR